MLNVKTYQEMKVVRVKSLEVDFTYVYLTLTFDSKVILVIRNLCSNVRTIGNLCTKYEHPQSKIRGSGLQAVLQIFSEFNLTFDPKVIMLFETLLVINIP